MLENVPAPAKPAIFIKESESPLSWKVEAEGEAGLLVSFMARLGKFMVILLSAGIA